MHLSYITIPVCLPYVCFYVHMPMYVYIYMCVCVHACVLMDVGSHMHIVHV